MNLYLDQFDSRYNFTCPGGPKRFLIIATTARSGSHMLGHSMYATGCLGFPLEYVNPANFSEWEKILNVSGIDSTMAALKSIRTSPNGVFSIKIHYSQLCRFGDIRHFLETFPGAQFILLTRQNVVKQAISYSIALQTGIWIDGQKGNNSGAEYNYALIDRCLREVIRDTAAWRYFLTASGCRFMELQFENVAADLARTMQMICNFVGIVDCAALTVDNQPATKSQTSSLNEEWARRFVHDYAGKLLF